jgi:hypothetical protein
MGRERVNEGMVGGRVLDKGIAGMGEPEKIAAGE